MKSKKPLKNSHGKGFTRTKKQWESSIADHIGKFVDRLSLDDVISLVVGGLAGLQFQDPRAVLAGAVAYKLARTEGLISQTAGVATLGVLTLSSIPAGVEVQPKDSALYGLAVKPSAECPEGSILRWNIVQGWHCEKAYPIT